VIAAAAVFQDVLRPAGPQAAHIAQLWWLTIAICAVVFIAILAVFLYSLWRAPRADAGTPADVSSLLRDEPRARRTVIAAVAVSTAGLATLLVASIAADRALASLDLHDALHIEVTAHQWWWDLRYDDPKPDRAFTTANELHVPVGRPVIVTLKSDDVIHSFWVPNLAGKKDLIPGHTTTLQLRADQPGTYRGQCAEFCGLQHAFMAFLVVAETPERFDAWAEAQRKPALEPTADSPRRGRQLFLSGPCMLCHAIQGTPASARKAPDLTHVASRQTLAAGTIANTPANLAAWILDPHKIKPGVNMPAHPLAANDLQALLAYMETLK
jgi:cytochrome c oxidase subunit 2